VIAIDGDGDGDGDGELLQTVKREGLTTEEAARLRNEYGANKLEEKPVSLLPPPSPALFHVDSSATSCPDSFAALAALCTFATSRETDVFENLARGEESRAFLAFCLSVRGISQEIDSNRNLYFQTVRVPIARRSKG
jgi:hypothetical protein